MPGADGHPDFTGVYHSPGYGPDDPPRGANTIARNIARDLKESDVPLNEYGKKLMAERTANNSKDDPEGLCLPMGTPRKDPYPWRIIHTPKLMVILYEGNIHSYRQIFLDGRPHDKRVEEKPVAEIRAGAAGVASQRDSAAAKASVLTGLVM